MADTVTTSEAAQMLGLATPAAARRALQRMGVKALRRNPGKGGESVYDTQQIRDAIARRPGQGSRRDLKTQETQP